MSTVTPSPPTSGDQRASQGTAPRATLPAARSVLAVVARPGDESCFLGAVLDAFRTAGGAVHLLSFTRGEASVYNDSMERLDSIRLFEFQRAAHALRSEHRMLIDYPDRGLSRFPVERLAEHVSRAVREWAVDLIVTIDGRVTERSAAYATVHAGRACDVPVLAWTLPHGLARTVSEASGLAVTGDDLRRIDFEVRVRRTVQRRAMREHRSQYEGDVLHLSRLAVQGDREWLRWLVPPAPGAAVR